MRLFKRRPAKVPERRRTERAASFELEDTTPLFRRGRTLTGSASPHVKSPNEAGADLKSSRVHAHALAKKRRRLTVIFILIALISVGLYITVSQFTSHAVVRASPDPSLQLKPIYAESIDEYLSGHMSQRWRFLTDTERLTEYLQITTPEVKEVRLRGSAGFGRSLFEVVFREPIASWSIDGRELYVDSHGIPFSRNYFRPPALRITDQSGMMSAVSGESVISNRFMGYIGQVIGFIKKQGYTVEGVTIPEGVTRQITVHLQGVAYPVKFSSDRPAGEAVDDMIKTIGWLKARDVTPEYVDVRVGGKVFYR